MHRNQFGGYVLNRYGTPQAGMAAMARTLMGYPSRFHVDTIASIVPHWAPASAGNNDAAYIANVAKWSGFSPNQHLDLTNPVVRDRLMAAMIRQEHGKSVTPGQVADTLNGNSLPASVNRLVNTLRRQQAQKPAHVTIRNQTAARIAVQTNAASY